MRRLGVVLLLLPLLFGCPPTTNRCAKDTLLVSLKLENGAEAADTFLVDIAIGGGGAMRSSVTHGAGITSGTIQIEFPRGYPRGQTVTVLITAQQGPTVLATQSAMIPIDDACETTTIVLTGAGVDDDLIGPRDLTGVVSEDLSIANDADMTGDLLALVDLAPAADFNGTSFDLGCVPTTEDCFNNVDDDCDNKIDCADTDCTGSASSPAVCVPNPGTFTAGTKVSGLVCPSTYPTTKPIYADLQHGCSGTCSVCGYLDTICSVSIKYGPSPSCVSGAGYIISQSTACQSFNIPAGDYHVFDAPYASASCAPATGSPTPFAQFADSSAFCSGREGGGCTGSQLCVPRAQNQCVMKAAGAATCPAGYNQAFASSPYFSGYSTPGQSCSCRCDSTGGVCTGNPSFTVYGDFGCSMGAVSASVGCSNQDISAGHGSVTGYTVQTPSTCTPVVSENNAPITTGPLTICCLP